MIPTHIVNRLLTMAMSSILRAPYRTLTSLGILLNFWSSKFKPPKECLTIRPLQYDSLSFIRKPAVCGQVVHYSLFIITIHIRAPATLTTHAKATVRQ